MELLDYLQGLKRGHSLRQIARGSGVSYGGVQAVFDGSTKNPTPDILERLALYFGESEPDKRRIYADLMRLAGYLEWMPQEGQRNGHTKHTNQLRQGNEAIKDETEFRPEEEDVEEEDVEEEE